MINEEKVTRYDYTSKDIKYNSNGKKRLKDKKILTCSKTRKTIIITIVVSVPVIIALFLFLFLDYPCIKCTEPGETLFETYITDKPTEDIPYIGDSNLLGPLKQELTNENDLTRIYVNQKTYENITINGRLLQNFLDRKTSYDIYIISSTESDEETKKYYNKTYLCAITISSECVSNKDEYCIPKKLVDFVDQDYSHAINLDEIEDLEDLPIPFCLFNITDNNVITSMLCPKSLSQGKKNTMILDLYFYKPPSIKRPDKDESNIIIDIENLPNNQKLIKEKSKGKCDVENYMHSLCINEMNITVDSNNKPIKYDEIAFTRIEKDQNNSYNKNIITNLRDESNINDHLNKEKYNKYLWKLLSIIEPYMQYDEYFSLEQFKELNLVTKKVIKPKEKKVLFNKNNYDDLFSEKLFDFEHEAPLLNINMKKNNTGIWSENVEALVDLKIDSENKNFSQLKTLTNIDKILNELILISKSGNNSGSLYEKIIENLNNLISVKKRNLNKYIFTNLKKFGNKLNSHKKRISDISTYYLYYKSNSCINYIKEIHNLLMTYLQKENELNIPQVNEMYKLFEENVLSTLEEQRKIINNLYQNLEENVYNIEIIELVKNEIIKELELKYGYFNSTSDINSNNETFIKVIEEALKISNNGKEELIDKNFDEIMIPFKERFTEIIKYMNKIKEQEFPLNENSLKDNFFNDSEKKKMSSDLESFAVDVVNSIRNENDYNKIEKKIENFLKNNEDYLIKLIDEIEVFITKDYFKKMENYFNKSLENFFQEVNETIKNNEGVTDNNYIKLQNLEIDSDQVLKKFIKEFDEYYSKLSIIINSYNEKIIELNEIITSIEKEILEQNKTLNCLSKINET